MAVPERLSRSRRLSPPEIFEAPASLWATRMLERYTHPTEARKSDALETFRSRLVTKWSQSPRTTEDELTDLADLLRKSGGRQEARTPDLRVANAALSQLS
jgi:hypothetical protein